MKEIKVDADFDGARLDRFLRKNIENITQAEIEISLRKRKIKVNNGRAKSNLRLKTDDIVSLFNVSAKNISPKKNDFIPNNAIIKQILDSIIFQDENILVLNKPNGLAVQGGSKIKNSLDKYLLHMFKDSIPKLVHRLDKDTSGVMIVALNNKTASELSHILKTRHMIKKYHCLVVGKVAKNFSTIELTLSSGFKVEESDEGKKAITLCRVIAQNNIVTLLEMQPITGRKHQIRVSACEIGHPIVGDGKYGGRGAFISGISNVLHLHAKEIEIEDLFGKKLKFKAPLPLHMQNSLKVQDL